MKEDGRRMNEARANVAASYVPCQTRRRRRRFEVESSSATSVTAEPVSSSSRYDSLSAVLR